MKEFIAPWEGRTLIIQNEKGSEKWPISPEFIEDFKQSFKKRTFGRDSDQVREEEMDVVEEIDHPKPRKSVFSRLSNKK